MLGSVFDEEDVRNRIAGLLRAHQQTALIDAGRVSFAMRLGPLSMLTIGQVSGMERRSSASLTMTSRSSVLIEPTDSVSAQELKTAVAEVAEELTARLALELPSSRR
ncbi:hypothetical protein [Nocardia sp. NPDC057353]|uniref:hypothetical protein n=1 Tax=Nocardia sp. NPDC057353 TaxID=3346104 RepID=UPI003641A13C